MMEKPIPHIFNNGEENEFSFRMIAIHGGTFDMGANLGDASYEKRSLPIQKNIEIKEDFFMAEVPVTQALWKAVMGGENPSHFKGDNRPVEQVSWDDAQDFLDRLNKSDEGKNRTAEDGKKYRLPTEARWEYAAKANEHEGTEFSGSKNLKEVGWFNINSHFETKPVGLKLPNAFGLYDMSGNVWEWCEDDWIDNLERMPKDGNHRKKDKNNNTRVIRGGSWVSNQDLCRLAIRVRNFTDDRYIRLGFRFSRY